MWSKYLPIQGRLLPLCILDVSIGSNRSRGGVAVVRNIPIETKIYWLDDVARIGASMDALDDLYAMPVEELRWRLENRYADNDREKDSLQ